MIGKKIKVMTPEERNYLIYIITDNTCRPHLELLFPLFNGYTRVA
jgi:hypothetical protein